MKTRSLLCVLTIALCFSKTVCLAQISSWVSVSANGTLVYGADENGNKIPDFSMVGYHQGERPIPNVPVRRTLNPGTGDRYTDIQNAIDFVAGLSPDANGHRGAILLTAGYYAVSQTLNIHSSGIVIRGEGKDENGTILELTATTQTDLFFMAGSGNANRSSSTAKSITDAYVPIGAKTVTVASGHSFQSGDRVYLSLNSNMAWIELLGMHNLLAICGSGHNNWSPRTTRYKRKVVEVNGNQITLDAPVVDPINPAYNTADLVKYTWPNKIEECGLENMRLLSSYTSETDEAHGWKAIELRNIENAWVRDVDAFYFGYGCVSAEAGSYQVSVLDCGMFDYKSQISGGRRYGFNSDDCDLILFKNCVSRRGRHDFVQGSFTPGPNVYTNCIATNSFSDSGPHHRWSTGTLWDLVSTDNSLNVRNRLCSGSGHGWAGAQQVLWNCTATNIILQDPPSNPTNWAIGCMANITNQSPNTNTNEALGVVESAGTPIASIPSLYEAQLNERLNGVLPVELVRFEAYALNNQSVQLNWETSSETNNDYFCVQRSANGLVWEEIHRLGGAGNSYLASNYQATDNSPLQGLSYYRLKQVDFDGSSTYSAVKTVVINAANSNSINIFPNPSANLITVETQNEEILGKATLYNLLGQEMAVPVFRLENAHQMSLDLSNLENGAYYLRIGDSISKVYKQ